MNLESNIIEYKRCLLCKYELVKLVNNYCNSCKKKAPKNPVLIFNNKVYFSKFSSKYNKRVAGYLKKYATDEAEKDTNIKTCQIQRSLTFIDTFNTQYISGLSFCFEFDNMNSLADFILKSDKVHYRYLLMVGATKLQKNLKIQKLIESEENELPSSKVHESKTLYFPYTSPLHLLTKSSFWNGLLKSYFQTLHGAFPILSITNFNPKTAPRHLLSAMYYCGYRFQPNQPEELTLYMDNYAKANLKLLIRKCSFSAIQSLLIYYSLYYRDGNVSLHNSCRAHATRIGYALGIHLDNKIFSELDNYTRKLVLIKIREINIYEINLGDFSINYLTEFGLYKEELVKPEWQSLSQRTIIHYETEIANFLYAECCTQLINYSIELRYHIFNASFTRVKESRFKCEWNKYRKIITDTYQKYTRIYLSLTSNYPNNFQIIKYFEYLVKAEYHSLMIEFYRKLKERLGDLSSSDMKEALYHCDQMLKLVLANNMPYFVIQIFIYIVGYQYLDLYKLCTATDRLLIQNQLTLIIEAISSNYLPSTPLSFLVLKNGYKSIINGNI